MALWTGAIPGFLFVRVVVKDLVVVTTQEIILCGRIRPDMVAAIGMELFPAIDHLAIFNRWRVSEFAVRVRGPSNCVAEIITFPRIWVVRVVKKAHYYAESNSSEIEGDVGDLLCVALFFIFA